MIISRTPYRISFFGGGSDYSAWYEKHGGAVLSTAINHYCFITVRHLPPFFPEKSRIVWSKIEAVADNNDIEHPSVRACLYELGVDNGIEIHHSGDLPARSGLGSSSSFTVGLLNALHALDADNICNEDLAVQAIRIERDVLKENVGVQDQIAAAYGGFNHIEIDRDGIFNVHRIKTNRTRELESHLLLFFTGFSRTASEIAAEQIKVTSSGSKDVELHRMREMVDQAEDILLSNSDILNFGYLLHESWMLKRSLTASISPQFVDDIYDRGRKAGAIGGKLLGAGGGGFILFFAEPALHGKIKAALHDLLWIPFQFEREGSRIIFNEPNFYSHESLIRRDYKYGL